MIILNEHYLSRICTETEHGTRLVDPCEELPGRSSRELPAAKVSPGAGSAATIAADLGVAMERPCRVAGKDSE